MDEFDSRAVRTCQLLARAAGLGSAAFGALALLGSLLGLESLGSFSVTSATREPIAAVCFLSLGVLLAKNIRSARNGRAALLCRALVCAASLGLLAANVLDASLEPPGRMASMAAISLALIAGAMVFPPGAQRRHVTEAQLLAGTGIAFVACLGYLYDYRALGRVALGTWMSLPNALALAALGAGSLLARPQGPLLRPLVSHLGGGVMARRVLLPAILLGVGLSQLELVGEREGWFGREIGMPIFVGATAALFTAIMRAAAASFNDMASARERATSELKESEHRIRQLTESLPMLIWTATPAGDCDFLSPQWTDYTGVPLAEHLGFGWLRSVHPEDRANILPLWSAAVSTGSNYYCEFRVRSHEGGYRWFNSRGAALRDLEGHVVKWFGSNADIHEARDLQETLRQHAMLIELAHDPIFTWSPSAGITFWNHGCEQLYGYSKAEALGRRSHELLHSVFPVSWGQFESELEAAGKWDGEVRHTTRDGRECIIASRCQRIAIDGNSIVLEAHRDITEQRRSEESLRASQRMEALGALAGGIAHDFNNIIAAIQGNANLAISDLSPDHAAQESLSEVNRAARRAADLVRQILTFSRQRQTEHEVVQLEPVVEEVLGLLRSVLPTRIELDFELCAERGLVRADPSQIHQVIMNLVTNAAHAIGERPGRIQVRLERTSAAPEHGRAGAARCEGPCLHLSVEDDGCGMDAATLERIFEPFFTTKPVGHGTGLGLSVVHGIMQSHGGTIRVQSDLGKGSTFDLYLPEAGQGELSAEARRPSEDPYGHGERLLYVDDEDALVFLATRILGRLGYEVEGYTDPAEALRVFRARADAFDAAITDLSMPSMSGMDLARELLRVRSDLPVLMMTGYVRAEDVATAKRTGVLDVVLKPNAVSAFGEMIHKALQARAPGRGRERSAR